MRFHALLLNIFLTAASAIEVQFYHLIGMLSIIDRHPHDCGGQVIQNGGFELNGGGDPGLDHWNKRGCQMSAEQWDVHQGETLHCRLKVQNPVLQSQTQRKLKGIAQNNFRRAFSPCESSPSRMGRC